MTRVYIVQCLCPLRHCILASPTVLPAQAAKSQLETAKEPLKNLIRQAIGSRLINPWCEICAAPEETWKYEIGRTQWETLEEALPALREQERKNIESQAAIKTLQREAANN
jgi:uncharacterized protein involved in exopolysaccharide biosynthesis